MEFNICAIAHYLITKENTLHSKKFKFTIPKLLSLINHKKENENNVNRLIINGLGKMILHSYCTAGKMG